MISTQDELFKDMEAVRQISLVPSMLQIICETTGMGFAAVARVTSDRWLACYVRDEIEFGLEAGGELKIETTLCNEVRMHQQPIIIDHVAEDPIYKNHHTPQIYGLQSYISIPIILKNGTFFGTLCAIDAKPTQSNNPHVIGTLTMFAELLSFHLQSLDVLERSYNSTVELQQKNKILTSVNYDLDSFVYTASHDLKSPISNIEGLLDVLSDTVANQDLDRDEINHIIELMKASTRHFNNTLQDLTSIVEADNSTENYEAINLLEVVEHVKIDLNKLISESGAKVELVCADTVVLNFSKKNLKSILYNLVSNAIKYRSPERTPEVLIKLEQVDGKINLSVTDNGLGIPEDKQDQVFTMFKRMHDHVEGSGLGLYIVKRILNNSNGHIHVKSLENQGTTFTVVL